MPVKKKLARRAKNEDFFKVAQRLAYEAASCAHPKGLLYKEKSRSDFSLKQGGANEPKMGDSPFLARWHRPALTRRGYRPERRRRELRVTRRGYHSKRRRRESVTSPVGVTSAPQALAGARSLFNI